MSSNDQGSPYSGSSYNLLLYQLYRYLKSNGLHESANTFLNESSNNGNIDSLILKMESENFENEMFNSDNFLLEWWTTLWAALSSINPNLNQVLNTPGSGNNARVDMPPPTNVSRNFANLQKPPLQQPPQQFPQQFQQKQQQLQQRQQLQQQSIQQQQAQLLQQQQQQLRLQQMAFEQQQNSFQGQQQQYHGAQRVQLLPQQSQQSIYSQHESGTPQSSVSEFFVNDSNYNMDVLSEHQFNLQRKASLVKNNLQLQTQQQMVIQQQQQLQQQQQQQQQQQHLFQNIQLQPTNQQQQQMQSQLHSQAQARLGRQSQQVQKLHHL
ncbi:uncharacterized protein PRCAT00000428001 [Priceomyces carsonii]|uniref:uncharacterized protein n=1 Tax=Priceomyces carsonii TaxID=28549 RepID=UPI002ED79A39|nr:unnamed protein product [Priceomyces carsonii]